MTPEQAETIYHKACTVEYHKHVNDYTPVNQRLVVLAGFAAVIEAVEAEQADKLAASYLGITT